MQPRSPQITLNQLWPFWTTLDYNVSTKITLDNLRSTWTIVRWTRITPDQPQITHYHCRSPCFIKDHPKLPTITPNHPVPPQISPDQLGPPHVPRDHRDTEMVTNWPAASALAQSNRSLCTFGLAQTPTFLLSTHQTPCPILSARLTCQWRSKGRTHLITCHGRSEAELLCHVISSYAFESSGRSAGQYDLIGRQKWYNLCLTPGCVSLWVAY